MQKLLNVSLVVPIFNEEKRFNSNYFLDIEKEISNAKLDFKIRFKIIFVDDGSSDSSYSKISRLTTNPNIDCLRLIKNSGKANAIRLGILEAIRLKSHFIAYLDSDQAFHKNEVAETIISVCQDCNKKFFDMKIFSRIKMAGLQIERTWFRHFIGRTIATVLNLNSQIKLYDSQSGFKIIGNNLLKQEIFMFPFETRWFLDWEIILRANQKLIIEEYPIKIWREKSGSKLKFYMFFRILIEISKIKMLQQRSSSGLARK